jgi:hypothetical protein
MTCEHCEINIDCILIGTKYGSEHCIRKDYFCIQCQIYQKQILKPTNTCQDCQCPSECYCYDYINGYSYFLRHFWVDRCQIEDCPHKEELEIVAKLYCTDGATQEENSFHEQSSSSGKLGNQEDTIATEDRAAGMVPRLPTKT